MKKIIIAAAIVIATVLGVALIDQAINPAAAKDCSSNAVAKCGVWSVKEMRNAYNNDTTKGLKNIYHGMGLTSDTINKATVKEGYVHKDGKVTIGSETVATDATSAGRTSLGLSDAKRAKRTHNGTTYYEGSTQYTFRSSKLAAFVFVDKDGKFLGAVLHDCGNPIKGKPTKKPEPTIKVCDLATMTYPVTIKEKDFDAKKHSKNPEDCEKKIKVCDLKTMTYPVTIKEKDFDSKKHSKNPEDCEKKIKVCDLTTMTYPVTIKEKDFDAKKHSKNPEDCEKKIKVCDLKTKQYPVTIKEKDFDSKKHSMNPEDCKEKPPVTIEVCELATKKFPVTINEKDFDATKHSKNPKDCETSEPPVLIEVCDLTTKTYPVTIDKKDFDTTKHSTNADDCKEVTPPVTPPTPQPPVELPTTGLDGVVFNLLGLGALVGTTIAYALSRRNIV